MPWIPNTQISSGGGSSSLYTSAQLVRYVDYVRGSDSNTGLSPSAAMKTIQAAYDGLVTVALATYVEDAGGNIGVGTLILLPGDHQVGTGVTLDRRYPVDILGTRSGWNAYLTKDSGSRIVSNSATATELIQIGDGTALGSAGSIVGVTFVGDPLGVNSALVSCIHSENVNYLRVERCAFTTPAGTGASISVAAIDMECGSFDHSWFRIHDCRSSRFCFVRTTGSPFNRGVIDSNVVFYDGPLAMMQFDGHLYAGTVSNNNLEGNAKAIQLNTSSDADKNVFINNSGESNADVTFYDFVGSCQHNIIIGGNCMLPGTNGTWVTFATNAHSNVVIGTVDATGVTGFKQKFTDNSTLGNTYINPNGSRRKYKSGAGVSTIADGDFSFGSTQDNGNLAVIHNTSDGTSRLAVKANGTWKYVTVA